MPSNPISQSSIQLTFLTIQESEILNQLISLFNSIGVTSHYSNPWLTLTNIQDITFHSDFFEPADTWSASIGGLVISQAQQFFLPGCPITISIGGKQLMTGFLDEIRIMADPHQGTVMHLNGRDVLGMMADSVVPPNRSGNGTNNYQFDPGIPLYRILGHIVESWSITNIYIDDSIALQKLGVGYQAGPKVKGRTAKARTNSLNKSINHYLKPDVTEGFLEYLRRICKNYGLEPKMAYGSSDSIMFLTPTYDRQNSNSPYQLIRQPGNTQSNVESGDFTLVWRHQPTAIVGQCNTSGQTPDGPTLDRAAWKSIIINEITALDYSKIGSISALANALSGNITLQQLQPYLLDGIYNQLLSETTNSNNYTIDTLNMDLIQLIQSNPQLIPPKSALAAPGNFNTNRIVFDYDYNASNAEDLQWGVMQKMSDFQLNYITLHYTVPGFFCGGNLWMQIKWFISTIIRLISRAAFGSKNVCLNNLRAKAVPLTLLSHYHMSTICFTPMIQPRHFQLGLV